MQTTVPLTDPLLLAAEAGGGGGLGFGTLNLLLVLLVAWAGGRLAMRVGYPAVLGELLGGIVFGPPLLGVLSEGEGLRVIGNLGIVLMMLYIGSEIDPADLRRASWPGLLAAVGGFIVPAGLGIAVVLAFGGTMYAALFVGIAVGVTSLATKSRILVDLDLLDTRIAHVLMAAALLSDTASLVAFAAIIGFVEIGSFDLAGTVLVAGEALGFFLVSGLLGVYVLPRLGALMERFARNDRMLNFSLVVLVGLGFAELAEFAGLHAILGSFIAGMFLRRGLVGERVQRDVNRLLADVSIGFLAPVFFVAAGFQITFAVFQTDLLLLISVVAVATFGKIFGTALFYLPTGHGWREGLTVGAAMNGRGAVEIIVAGIGLELGLISAEIFTILVFMAIATTATVPVLLKLGVEWLRRHGELARSEEKRVGVLIVGAGATARRLATHLAERRPVWLIDDNADQCAEARREGLIAIRGNALDSEILQRAHIGRTRALIAMTPNSEVNILAAQLARDDFLVPEVHVTLQREPTGSFADMLERVGARPMFDEPVEIGLWDQWVATGRARSVEVEVDENTDAEELYQRLRGGRGGFPLIIERADEILPFASTRELLTGDRVVLLTTSDNEPPAATVTGSLPATKG